MKVLDYDGLEYYNGLIENKYLPKSGGTMTGAISKSGQVIKSTTDDSSVSILGGTDSTSSYINIYGKNHATEAGTINLRSYNGTNSKYLTLKPDGTLTWGGNSIALSKDFLPLSGGTMSGALAMNSSSINLGSGVNDNGRIYEINNVLRLVGGTNTSTGSYIDIGSSSSSTKGVVLGASDGNGTTKLLKALYDGTLTWGGTSISLNGHTHSYLPLSGGTMTGEIKRNGVAIVNTADNGYTQYNGGKDDTSSYICIYGKSHSSNAGVINLRAYDGTNSNYLKLTPTGDLTWGGKDVLTTGKTGVTSSKTQSGSLSVAASTQKTIISLSLAAGTWLVYGHAKFDDPTSGKTYSIELTKTNNRLSFTDDSCQTVHAASASDIGVSCAAYFGLSSTTTIYLTCYVGGAAGTVTGSSIYAIRLK